MGTMGRLLLLMVMVTATCITPGKSLLSMCTLYAWGALISGAFPVSFNCQVFCIAMSLIIHTVTFNNQHVEYISRWCHLWWINRQDDVLKRIYSLYIITPSIGVNIREISFISFKFVTFFVILNTRRLEFNIRGLILIPICGACGQWSN